MTAGAGSEVRGISTWSGVAGLSMSAIRSVGGKKSPSRGLIDGDGEAGREGDPTRRRFWRGALQDMAGVARLWMWW